MLGVFKAEVKIGDETTLLVDGKPIKVVSNRDPLKLPWAELGIDIVIEVCKFCTHEFSRMGKLDYPSKIERSRALKYRV
jgi:glyceraldehyde-3-phosphate dehydrogenase/erythrose-4-phosphate dehydrogenase